MLVVHYQMAHIGRQKLIEMVKQHVWNPNLSKVAADITVSCDVCQHMKVSSIVAPPMNKITTTSPFELVAMDLVSLPPAHGNIGCLVVMDHHTKWLSAVAIKSKTSASIASAFEYRVLPFLPHWPVRVLTDNGPEFAGEAFNGVLNQYGIIHQYTTPNKPSSNGLVERANRTLLELIRLQLDDTKSWYGVLPRAVMVHNTTFHSAINQSPSEFIFANKHLFRGNVILPSGTSERWRDGHPSFGTFKFDQFVLRKSVFRGRETVNKFSERFEGPYSIKKINRNGITYVIKHEHTNKEVKAHHSQLKAYHLPPDYIRNHPYYESLRLGELPLQYENDVPSDTEPSSSDDSFESYEACPLEFSTSSVCSDVDFSFRGFTTSDQPWKSTEIPVETGCHDSCAVDLIPMDEDSSCVPLWDERRLLPFIIQNVGLVVPEVKPRIMSDLLLHDDELQRSGIVIEPDSVFWEVSEISVDFESSLPCLKMNEDDARVFYDGLDLLNETTSVLNRISRVSPSSAFSGFSRRHNGGDSSGGSGVLGPDFLLSSNNDTSSLKDFSGFNCFIDKMQQLAERLADMREIIERQPPLAPNDGHDFGAQPVYQMRTRSQGIVSELPNVQPTILEYKRLSKQ